MKRILLCFVSLLLAFSLAACSSGGLITSVKGSGIVTKGKKLPKESDGVKLSPTDSPAVSYNEVASNGSFKLWYDEKNSAVRLTDVSGEKVWDSIIDYKSLGLKLSAVWKQNVSSMFEINYSHPNENGRERIVSASMRKLKLTFWSEKVDNGIDILYYFPERKLGFKAQFRLTDTGFTVNIPAESIIENGEYRFVSVNMLPYFSAISAGQEGYILSPYSSGAILEFGSETEGRYIQLPIYSESNIVPQENHKLDEKSSSELYSSSNVCALPLVGMTDKTKGFVAYADELGEDSYINMSTAYYGIAFNRASFCCYIRNVTTLNFSGNDGTAGTADVLDDDIIPTDKKLCYDLLGENGCDYNAMAECYRKHLLSKGFLKKGSSEKATVSIELLMGVPRKEIAGTAFVKTTTLKQAYSIVEQLGEKGIENAIINLKGWNKKGYGATPTEAGLASAVGSMKDLKELVGLCKKMGYKLCLEAELCELNTDFSNLSAKKTSIVDSNGFFITNSTENVYFQRLSVMQGGLKDIIDYLKKSGISGLNFNGFGSLLYRDYNKTVTYSSDMSKGFADMIAESKKTFDTAAVRGTNLYALLKSDYSYDVQIPFSGDISFSAYVPFLQLVTGDAVGLISDPINSFYNPEQQKLMLLEYNAIPNFELTFDSVYSLQDTHYNTLFSAKFELWIDTISEQYKIRNDNLGAIDDSYPIKHEQLDNGMAVLTFENGKRLVINKGKTEQKFENIMVKACDFAIVD